jgi:hypothetical protein
MRARGRALRTGAAASRTLRARGGGSAAPRQAEPRAPRRPAERHPPGSEAEDERGENGDERTGRPQLPRRCCTACGADDRQREQEHQERRCDRPEEENAAARRDDEPGGELEDSSRRRAEVVAQVVRVRRAAEADEVQPYAMTGPLATATRNSHRHSAQPARRSTVHAGRARRGRSMPSRSRRRRVARRAPTATPARRRGASPRPDILRPWRELGPRQTATARRAPRRAPGRRRACGWSRA